MKLDISSPTWPYWDPDFSQLLGDSDPQTFFCPSFISIKSDRQLNFLLLLNTHIGDRIPSSMEDE